MPPIVRLSNAPSSASPPARRDVSRPDDQDMASFDLRQALAGITVRETSFSEFLAALRKNGKRPG